MTNHPYYLMREIERIRTDVREVLDWAPGIAKPEIDAALLKVCGRLQGVEDHLSDHAFEAETRSLLVGDATPDVAPTPPADLVADVAALTARQRRVMLDTLMEGFIIDTGGVSVMLAPKAPAPQLLRKPAN